MADTKEAIKKRLIELFVEQFEKIDSAKNHINNYLSNNDIDFKYDYDEFCRHFLEETNLLFNYLNDEDVEKMNMERYIQTILSLMVEDKAIDSLD